MMNRVPVVSNLSPLLSDMTGTCLRRVDVIVLMAFQRAVTSPLSSVTSSLFLFFFFFFFFFFFCPHTHMLSFHRSLSLSALLSISLWFLPTIASAPHFVFFFFFSPDLQELFDLLTDLFYLCDLVMSFQHHLCGDIEGKGGREGGVAFSSICP